MPLNQSSEPILTPADQDSTLGARRQRMWDDVYAAVFASRWRAPSENDDSGPGGYPSPYELEIDGADRAAASAADDAIERLDRFGWGLRK